MAREWKTSGNRLYPDMGSQLSWLERAPDKREVGGSSPLEPTNFEVHLTFKVFEQTFEYLESPMKIELKSRLRPADDH